MIANQASDRLMQIKLSTLFPYKKTDNKLATVMDVVKRSFDLFASDREFKRLSPGNLMSGHGLNRHLCEKF
jgi:hypothetical protein